MGENGSAEETGAGPLLGQNGWTEGAGMADNLRVYKWHTWVDEEESKGRWLGSSRQSPVTSRTEYNLRRRSAAPRPSLI